MVVSIEVCLNGWKVEENYRKTIVFTELDDLVRYLRWRLLKQSDWQALPENYDTGEVDYD